MTEKGHATVLLSREELEVLEYCLLYCLENDVLDDDTALDAEEVLAEIRLFMKKDPQGVADAIGEEVKSEYRGAEPRGADR